MAFAQLRPDATLALRAAACLPVRAQDADCHACVDACPPRVLSRHDGPPALADGCLGCGRCAAACPSGALRLPGFAVTPSAGKGPVAIDCWRVPVAEGSADTLRVPCLHGLTLGRLLQIAADAEGRSVELLDRGLCAACPAGDARRIEDLIGPARTLLAELGVPQARQPRVARRPLPPSWMRREPTSFADEERLSRRGFLTALTNRTAAAADDLGIAALAPPRAPRSAPSLRERPLPEERQRLLAALGRLAPGVPLPRRLFPQLTAGPSCADHRVCAALCPTGALTGYQDDAGGRRGLAFDPAACIGCGLCVAHCPTQALRLTRGEEAPALGADASAVRELTRHGVRHCDECGTEYIGGQGGGKFGAGPLCPACTRDRDFAKTAFAALFGGASRG